MNRRLIGQMAAAGLQYQDRTHTYNTRLAQELATWGDDLGATDALHDALFRAYFVDGLNLAHPDVLVAAAESAGLDPREARRVLEERPFAKTVDDHWRAAKQRGVTGVPTLLAGGLGVVGAQPYEVLTAFMERASVPRRDGGAN